MQTACTQDWWDDRKYGDNLTLENITVKGNVLFVDLPGGERETLYLDSVKTYKNEVEMDISDGEWNDVEIQSISCDGTNNTYRQMKTHKGNLRIYDAVFYTVLQLNNKPVLLTFTHDIVGVYGKDGIEAVRVPTYQYNPVVKDVNWQREQSGTSDFIIRYHLQIEVTDNKIPVGTIDVMIKTKSKSFS